GLMRVVIHPEAEQEFEIAALWYEERAPGLGSEFVTEFERARTRILAAPEQPRVFRANDRKLNFSRFPYAIVYTIKGEILFIKAVMHLHRRPFYWAGRKMPPVM